MHNFSTITNRKYYVIPNASPKEVPASNEDLRQRNNFDIVFIGAKYKTKNFLFKNVIPNLKKSGSNKISIGLFGKGFNKRVKVSNGIIKFFNKTIKVINPVMTNKINNKISKFATVISESREPLIYKNSKICINYHEDTPNHIIYNMRYFKIPYYGGFQIVDSPLDKSPYFNDDEVVHLSSKKVSDWVDTINFYLQNPHERLKIQKKGNIKAKRMHSYSNRASQFLNIYNQIKSNIQE